MPTRFLKPLEPVLIIEKERKQSDRLRLIAEYVEYSVMDFRKCRLLLYEKYLGWLYGEHIENVSIQTQPSYRVDLTCHPIRMNQTYQFLYCKFMDKIGRVPFGSRAFGQPVICILDDELRATYNLAFNL